MDSNHNEAGLAPEAELNHLSADGTASLVPAPDPDTNLESTANGAGQQTAPLGDTSNSEQGDKPYEVGYKRPPRHSRFKPGQSGNPKGRRPKLLDIKNEIQRDFLSKVPVRVGSKTVHATKIALLVRQMTAKGINGDTRAAMAAFKIAEQYGVLKIQDQHRFFENLEACLTPEEREVQAQWRAIMDKHKLVERYIAGARSAGLQLPRFQWDDQETT